MATIDWANGVSGLFTTAADWSPATVPTASDDVVIEAPGLYTVAVSANITINSLATSANARLAVRSGHALAILNGTTGPNGNAGVIAVNNGGALQIGGAFNNTGRIRLNSSGLTTQLVIAGATVLSGAGRVALSDNAGNAIVGPSNTVDNPQLTVMTTIAGAGAIGANLTLTNDGRIVGNGTAAALILDTAGRPITNSGVIDGSTAEGVIVDSNVQNSGVLEAAGTDANLTIEAAVTNLATPTTPQNLGSRIVVSGAGAHVGLSGAAVIDGAMVIGTGGVVETLADSGASSLEGVLITGGGTLQANTLSTLDISGSTIETTDSLVASGLGGAIIVNGATGAVASTIDGGKIEFNGASAANVSVTAGAVGALKLDSTFTGTVSGLAAAVPTSFSNLFTFGDSTVDAGALRFLSPDIGDADLTARLQNAFANGGTDSPVGVGAMNPQDLAAMFGLSANTAYTTGGVVGGGGTDYAISGALDAADLGDTSTGDPGNGGLTNTFQLDAGAGPINPAVLSTVAQIQTYLASTGGVADPQALYYISSGANDVSYAESNLGSGITAYLAAQAQSLASEIEALYNAGARHILVNDVMNNKADSYQDYSSVLFADLDASGVLFTPTDGREMNQTVINHPSQYGFTSVSTNDPALVNPNPAGSSAFGLWGADTTTPESSAVPAVDQYSYLQSPTSEQTSFFSDSNGHLSTAGQQVQATYNYDLLTNDTIDLTSEVYDPVNTKVSFAGNTTSGVLTVSNTTQSESITLLGDYTHAVFATASDGAFIDASAGTTGTLVMDTGNSPQMLSTTSPH